MEWIPAISWICLLGSCLTLDSLPAPITSPIRPALTPTTSLALPQHPRLLNCVFRQRANITCRWEPGEPHPSSTTRYTLQISKMHRRNSSLAIFETFNCSTSHTSCTVGINKSSVAFIFCVNITAHTPNGIADSVGRCQSGRDEVMLSPVTLLSAEPVSGKPQCLMMSWSRSLSYVVSDEEIREGKLFSQIEHTSQYQPLPQVTDVEVRECNITACYFTVCHFAPDTLYNIRLRHHFKTTASPWSHWSNPWRGQTAEDAPSAAPAFWRTVEQTDQRGWRHVSLLWKPLHHSLANGRVLSYNVTCRRKSGRVLKDHGSCSVLHRTRTSCGLPLPPESCCCSLTASNSAGSSPEAHIWLLKPTETEPPPPDQITVNPLDDSRLEVRWTAPLDQSVSGFVVEWSAVTEKQNSTQHWDRLNGSRRSLVITGGVKPMVRYAVSVKVVYVEGGAGCNRTVHVYTRQGVPSAGPKVKVHEISGDRVKLRWSLIPVEQQHGYIRNYTLHYTQAEEHSRSVCVPGEVQQYSLGNLLPGDYYIYMQANTDAGAGVAGHTSIVNIGTEDIIVMLIVKCAILPVILTSLALMLVVCLGQSKMVKQKLCQDIPDPSHSSLAHWTPNAFWENVKILPVAEKPKIQISEVLLAGENELQNSGPVQVFSYHTVHSPHIHSSQTNTPDTYSPFSQIPHSTRTPEEEPIGEPLTSPTKTTITPDTEQYSPAATLSPYYSPYSQVLFSPPPQAVPQSLLTTPMPTEWLYMPTRVNDSKLQQGGESELPVYQRGKCVRGSAFCQTDKLENVSLSLAEKSGLISLSPPLSFPQSSHPNPVTPLNLSAVSRSSSFRFSLSDEDHSLSTASEWDLPSFLFSPTLLNSFALSRMPKGQLSEPNPGDFYLFPCPISPSSSFSTSLSLPHPFFYNPSSLPLLFNVFSEECDPYVSTYM